MTVISVPENSWPSVGQIVKDLCGLVGVTSVNTTAIDGLAARGFLAAGSYNVADTIRALQRAYFFELPEIDGQLVAIVRGGASVATILRTDMVRMSEAEFETAREQGVEFPLKLHLMYASAETDYTPTKQTSERRSVDVKAVSEITVEVPINLEADEAAQIADKMHKVAWSELEGTAKFAVTEKFAYLVPSDPVTVEVSSGVMKRIRIEEIVTVDGILQISGVADRITDSVSVVVAPPVIAPTDPVGNLPFSTQYEIMDLPALLQSHDTLHVYVAAHGNNNPGWTGAIIEQLVDTEWTELGRLIYPSNIGFLQEAVADNLPGVDTTNTVLVTLSDDDIASITQAEFDAGGNVALLGNELINFRDAVQEGDSYRLSYLTRGVLNTTTEAHAFGERFVLLVAPAIIPIDASYVDQSVTLRVYSLGTTPAAIDETTFTFTGQSQTEWAPKYATMDLSGEDWLIDWQHNKRIGAPDNAIVSVHFVEYGIRLTKGATVINMTFPADGITYTNAEQLVDFAGAVASFDSVEIWGINEFTGAGGIALAADITGDRLLMESGGALILEDGSGTLRLEF